MKFYKFFFIGLLLFISGKLFCIPFAKNGKIDLSAWDFNISGPVKLAGYYYEGGDFFKVPGYFKGFGQIELSLEVILPENQKGMGIYLEHCQSAYELYIDGQKILSKGTIGDKKSNGIIMFDLQPFKIKKQSISINWIISNHQVGNSGPSAAPVIGLYKDLKKSLDNSIYRDFFICGAFLIIFLTNIFFFLALNKKKEYLNLALFALIMLIRIIVKNNLIYILFPSLEEVSLYLLFRMDYMTGPLKFSILGLYGLYFFKEKNKILKKIVFVSFYSSLILSIMAFLLPLKIFSSLSLLYNIMSLSYVFISIIILLSAIFNKKGNVILIIIPTIIFIAIGINDALHAMRVIDTLFMVPFAFLLFAAINTIILATKLSQSYNTAKYLTSNLQNEVKKRTFELEEANRQKTDFFINLAHETKTPLTLVSNYLEKYLKEHEKNNDLLIIKQNIEKLKNDMVNFLDTEKLKRNQFLYDHDQICYLSDLVINKNHIFKETAEQNGIDLNWNTTTDIYIKADPLALDRILNNLLDNAVKYTEKKGSIHVALRSEDNKIIIKVTDTGTGISEEYREKIFAPFYQIYHKKKNIQGLGMGLSITKQIIDDLGGSISFNSVPSKGTDFIVILPKYEKQPGDIVKNDFELTQPVKNIIMEEDLFTPKHDDSKKSIFIVEDNLQMIAGLIDHFEKNFNIEFSMNGKEALKKINIIPRPDVVISDIMMDEMDGYEFRERLLKSEEYRSIPFIFLTAKNGVDEKLKGLGQGAVDFISKPFNMDELEEKIKTWVLLVKLNKNRKDISEIHKKRFDAFIKEYDFSKREIEILGYLLDGKTNREIVEKMGVSDSTVRSHLGRIKIKMDISKKTDLIDHLFNYVYQ